MPFLPVSAVARSAETLVRGAVRLTGLAVLLVAFIPVAPALALWPLLPEARVIRLLELYRSWAVAVIGSHHPPQRCDTPALSAARFRRAPSSSPAHDESAYGR